MSLEHEIEWWTCEECGAQAATWAVVFSPLPPDLDAYRNSARFGSSRGEPCATKPKPLGRRAEPAAAAHEEFLRRRRAEEEAAGIMEAMAKRRRAHPTMDEHRKNGASKRRRPVLVDGRLYESVTAAAAEVGTTPQHLGRMLLDGKRSVKGRAVLFAESDATRGGE